MSLAPLDLVSADAWHRVTFTILSLRLSFFEAIVLDRLIRGGGRQAMILADVEGVRASLGEQGAQRVGKDYDVEPVAVTSGVFHPKVSVFSGREDCHLLVGSGNLTFGGWGANFEALEHLHPSFAADAFSDAAEFFERLSITGRVRHGARADCDATAADLRRAIEGRPLTGNIRFLHNLDWSIAEQVVAAVEELGGATQLIAAAPFWDNGAAIDRLCAALRLDRVLIHAHAHGAVEGRAGANWPTACRGAVQPVRLDVMTEADKPRRLHAKAFEILCRQGCIVVSGSANATGAALEVGGNVEACVMRKQRERKAGWTFVPAEVPDPQPALETDHEEDLQKCGPARCAGRRQPARRSADTRDERDAERFLPGGCGRAVPRRDDALGGSPLRDLRAHAGRPVLPRRAARNPCPGQQGARGRRLRVDRELCGSDAPCRHRRAATARAARGNGNAGGCRGDHELVP